MGIGDWIFIGMVCVAPLPLIALIILEIVGCRNDSGSPGSSLDAADGLLTALAPVKTGKPPRPVPVLPELRHLVS